MNTVLQFDESGLLARWWSHYPHFKRPVVGHLNIQGRNDHHDVFKNSSDPNMNSIVIVNP